MTIAEAPVLLEVRDLSTFFPTPRGVVHAVDRATFSLRRGETLGIVGESGSGKSVLARTIMRLNPPTAITRGSIVFEQRELTRMTNRAARSIWGREISMVFQNPMTSLNPVMKVGRQIAESLQLHRGLGGDAARRRSIELLDMVRIPGARHSVDKYPHQFSGGMRQRVGIAIALACSPKLLLADEPTTALDVTIQRQILDLLTDLQRDTGMAMVLITHDLGVVAGRTDRVMVMYGGQVVESGTTAGVYDFQRHPYTASLLAAIPRIERTGNAPLGAIPGRPLDVVDPPPMCRFAPRCARSQHRCVSETPSLVAATGAPDHQFRCFFPNGTIEGDAALAANLAAGVNAAGLDLRSTRADVIGGR